MGSQTLQAIGSSALNTWLVVYRGVVVVVFSRENDFEDDVQGDYFFVILTLLLYIWMKWERWYEC